MRVKFNRGPQHGKYQDFPDSISYRDRIEIRVVEPLDWRKMDAMRFHPDEPLPVKRGDYARSNKTLKNGAVVFEWLGWRE